MSNPFKKDYSRGWDWLCAAIVALVSAALFAPLVSAAAFPGESAKLMCVWRGLDASTLVQYPLAKMFAAPFGYGNWFAPVCGAVAAVALFHIANFLFREMTGGEYTSRDAAVIGRTGGAVAALVFMFSPAVLDSATHLEPRLFDAAWALVALALSITYSRLPQKIAFAAPLAIGAMGGMLIADSSEYLLLVPVCFAAVWAVSAKRGGRGYGAASLYLVAFFAVALFWSVGASGPFQEYLDGQKSAFRLAFSVDSWYIVPLFATFPCIVAVFAGRKSFGARKGWTDWSFHMMMTLVAILAVSTEFSPSDVMRFTRVPPVMSCAAAAFVAGYVLAYWWSQTRPVSPVNESVDATVPDALARRVGIACGGLLSIVLFFTFVVNRFVAFDASKGDFADTVASMVVEEMGAREWLVTDGSIDSHLLLAADKAGRNLNLVSLVRESDKKYIKNLAARAVEKRIAGAATAEVADALVKYPGLDRQRIVPFIQKWFATDPDVAKKAAVFGAPDLWLYANVEPSAGIFVFGGDGPDKSDIFAKWPEIDSVLHAPKGWGSAGLYDWEKSRRADSLERQRLNLRRHVGFLATDRGYELQIEARKAHEAGDAKTASAKASAAFDIYELVLNEIDADNVSALFNEFELARTGYCKKAEAKQKAIIQRLNRIKEDETRRYALGDLGLLYGYVCNPDIIMRYGLSLLLKAGRPGDAVHQLRRAIEFVPAENRAMAELNLLASVYASGGDREKARKIYNDALVRDPGSREALKGLARLALLEGDMEKAESLLKKITDGAEDDLSVFSQKATLLLMQNKLDEAKEVLRKVTDKDRANLEAWSLLAATIMREIDALAGDASPGAAEKKARLEKELDESVIPTMEAQARSPSDYYLLSTKAFSMMRKEGDEAKRKARDTFIAVAKGRPDITSAADMVMGLDIQLNDVEDAERQAVDTLAIDRNAPLANYVLGSIALGKEDFSAAESHLRIAADAKRAVPLAMNDLAEVLRRTKRYDEAEAYARKAVAAAPGLYVAWETLGSVLMDAGKSFDEAEQCIQKAVDLSKDASGRAADARMLIALARVQLQRGEKARAKGSLRAVLSRIDELSEFEKREFEELRKSAR